VKPASGDLFGDGSQDEAVQGAGGRLPVPLAERFRPRDLSEVVGPPEVFGPESFLGKAIAADRVPSLILWGPPGSGKTTLARIIAARTKARFLDFSAVNAGVKEIREVLEDARRSRERGVRTLLFLDEIHRWSRSQQDLLLPYTESGAITLVGATTENPSFELNGALLSRSRVVVLPPLGERELVGLMKQALGDPERGLGGRPGADDEALAWLARFADGDARRALNGLESAASQAAAGETLSVPFLEKLFSRKVLLHDKSGEAHYDLISALHKALRDSDVDGSLYWLARMLEAGEDPLYVARRLVRFASEDVGLADRGALSLALAGRDAVHFLGMPEGALALAEVAVYLALAPKSNALYVAYGEVAADVQRFPNEPPPLAIRNAPTALMEKLGYGKGYQYAHDLPEGTAGLETLPSRLEGRNYYRPAGEGAEAALKARADAIRTLRSDLAARRRKRTGSK
jgi:putative ATPase